MAEPADSRSLAPIIVTAELGRADQAWADALRRRHYPPERNQVPAHITLFRHLAPSLESELRTMLGELSREPRPVAAIRAVKSLGTGVAIALHSPDILAPWEHLAERFDTYLTPQDRSPPDLHITIQNKVTPAVAKATLTELSTIVTPRPIEIAALACWHYRGGPWSPIARYPFRG